MTLAKAVSYKKSRNCSEKKAHFDNSNMLIGIVIKKIKGFRVLKTESFKSFTDLTGGSLLPAKQRKFKDPKIAKTNYYAVEAIGFNKDEKVSSGFHYEHIGDTIPPAIPVGLKADVDSSGVVRISWKPNTDSDLLGYRVYSSRGRVPSIYNFAEDHRCENAPGNCH